MWSCGLMSPDFKAMVSTWNIMCCAQVQAYSLGLVQSVRSNLGSTLYSNKIKSGEYSDVLKDQVIPVDFFLPWWVQGAWFSYHRVLTAVSVGVFESLLSSKWPKKHKDAETMLRWMFWSGHNPIYRHRNIIIQSNIANFLSKVCNQKWNKDVLQAVNYMQCSLTEIYTM